MTLGTWAETSAPPDGPAPLARPVREVLEAARSLQPQRDGDWGSPIALGFDLLDRVLDGGLRSQDLLLLGGSPGVGKTVAALQIARHTAKSGHPSVYVSFEHGEAAMLGRLLVLELGELSGAGTAPDVDRLRSEVVAAMDGYRSLERLIAEEPLVQEAVRAVGTYADDLWFVRGSGSRTDVATLGSLVEATDLDRGSVLYVDYLQKVAVHPDPPNEAEKVTRVVEALKDLALRRGVAVVALVAADWDGIGGGRVRLHHLRGSSALAYECDVAVMMNEKHGAVSKVHLAYDPVKAETFRHQVVFSVEKNRGGPAMVDVEFRKDFMHYRFDPRGSYLTERLVDDRLNES